MAVCTAAPSQDMQLPQWPTQTDLTEAPHWLIRMHKEWQGWPALRNSGASLGTGRPDFNKTLSNKPGVI